MAKYTVNLNADGTYLIATIKKPGGGVNAFEGTVHLTGTFGGGSVKLQTSPDGGTTKVDCKDISGSAYSATANDMVNIKLGDGGTLTDCIKLYAVLSGSTAPNINATLHSNL